MTIRQTSAVSLAVVGCLALSPGAAAAAGPDDPGDALVVRLEALSETSPFGGIISVHADGRLITANESGLTEQRLGPDEVATIRQLLADTGLFGPNAPATAEYLPTLRPGKDAPGRGPAQQRIVVGTPSGTVSAVFEIVIDYEADLWFPSPEAERLAPLHDLLWSLFDPAAPDGSGGRVAYSPKRYQLTLSSGPVSAQEGIAWPLVTPLEALPVTTFTSRFQGGWPSAERLRCAVISPDEAKLVGEAAAEALLIGNDTDRMMFDIRGAGGESHTLRLEALLPDERGCGPLSPDTAVSSGAGSGATSTVAGLGLLLLAGAVAAGRAFGKRWG